MPETQIPENALFAEIKKEVKAGRLKDEERDVLRLVENTDAQIIGAGGECVVVPTPDGKTEKVVAFNYRHLSPVRAKQIFYAHRILETLFPHNFPHFYAAFGGDTNEANTGTIRKKINPPGLKGRINRLVNRYPFSAVEKECEELGIPLRGTPPRYDRGTENIIVGADGGEYFVDTIKLRSSVFWDKDKIASYMERKGFDETKKRIVSKSIERLHGLDEEDVE